MMVTMTVFLSIAVKLFETSEEEEMLKIISGDVQEERRLRLYTCSLFSYL